MSILSSTYSGKKYYEWMENLRWYAKKNLYYLYSEKYRKIYIDRECEYYMPIIQDGIMHYEKKDVFI